MPGNTHSHPSNHASQVIMTPVPSQVIVITHPVRCAATVIVRPQQQAPLPANGFYSNPHASALFFGQRQSHPSGSVHAHVPGQPIGQVHAHAPASDRVHAHPPAPGSSGSFAFR